MSLASQVSALATRIGTEIKTVRTEIAARVPNTALPNIDCVIRYTGTQPLRSTGTTDSTRRVRWVSSTAPSTAAGYALPGDVWEHTT